MFFFDPRFTGPLDTVHSTPPSQMTSYGLPGVDGTPIDLGDTGDRAKLGCFHCHTMTEGGHDTRAAAASSPRSLGVRRFTTRHAQTMVNTVYSPMWTGWDGRRDSVWAANIRPPERGGEGRASRLEFVQLMREWYGREYDAIFALAAPYGPMPDFSDPARFPPRGRPGQATWDAMTADDKRLVNRVWSNFGKAIHAYLMKTICVNSRFDKWMAGDDDAMTPAEIRGAQLFAGKANCIDCHTGPNLSDYKFHNTGIEGPPIAEEPTDPLEPDLGRVRGIDILLETANDFLRNGEYSDFPQSDHLAGLTPGLPPEGHAELGKFRTPGLRCIAQTPPYMHAGQIATLEEVVEFYDRGGDMPGDPLVKGFVGEKSDKILPLNLTADEKADLVAFLKALDGEPVTVQWGTAPAIPGLCNGNPATCPSPYICAKEQICLLPLGASCIVNNQCDSRQCECTNADCSARVCAPVSCTCKPFDTTLDACSAIPMTDGLQDPGDCDLPKSCSAGACP